VNTNFGLKRNASRICAALVVLTLLPVGFGTPVFAQSDYDEKIEELEKALAEIKASIREGQDVGARIEALEAELAELKQDIAAGEPSEEEGRDQVAAVKPEAQLPPAGVQGAPNPLQDDKKYLTGQDLLDESFPNSWPIPGTNTRFAVGGYAKLDFIQDFDYVGDRFEFELATIPVEGTPEAELDGQTTLHAKETRINFDFRGKAHNKRRNKDFPLQVFLEMDFFEDREELSRQPRLRHAYGVVGRFLAGQTWTTSADLEALPGLIDFADGDALYGNRAAQVRWQDRAGEILTWAVALESPDSEVGNPLGFEGENRIDLPNLAGRLRWTTKKGSHFQMAGDLYQLNWQGGETGPSDSALGWGVNLTGRYLLGSGNSDAIMGGLVLGEGAAHRIVSLGGSGSSGVLTPSGDIDVLSVWEANIGYSHYWTQSLNSTISTAWTELDNSEFQPGDEIHRAGSFHLNLIWFPYKLASTGFEIMWGERVNKDGAKGEAWRLQYMAKYKFN
jgi:hypothetical protein